MLRFVHGDIFLSTMHTITNPVNCVGVMGKGLAFEFKNRYPRHFTDYRKMCQEHKIAPGVPAVTRADCRSILLFPTKDHWRNPSELQFIEEGLKFIAEHYEEMGIYSLALPKLGAGLGGLKWADVKALIIKYLGNLPINIEVYE